MGNVFSVVAPANCTSLIQTVLPASYCQLPPKLSEIDLVIFRGTAAGPASMGNAPDWTGLIDNADATGAKMHYLIGSGTIAEAEESIQTVARGQEVVTNRVWTLVFTVFELSDAATYDYLRLLQTGALKPPIYYTSRAGFMYGRVVASGPDNGITLDSIKVAFPKEAGNDAIDKAIITMKWSADVDPDRVVNVVSL